MQFSLKELSLFPFISIYRLPISLTHSHTQKSAHDRINNQTVKRANTHTHTQYTIAIALSLVIHFKKIARDEKIICKLQQEATKTHAETSNGNHLTLKAFGRQLFLLCFIYTPRILLAAAVFFLCSARNTNEVR